MSCIYINKEEWDTFYKNVLKFRFGKSWEGGALYKYNENDIYDIITDMQNSHYDYMNKRYSDQADSTIKKVGLNEVELKNKFKYESFSPFKVKQFIKTIHYIVYQTEQLSDRADKFLKDLIYDLSNIFIYGGNENLDWGVVAL